MEQEETSILQAMKQPLKQHMATLHFSALQDGCREEVTSLEMKLSHQGSLILRKGFYECKLVFCSLNFQLILV